MKAKMCMNVLILSSRNRIVFSKDMAMVRHSIISMRMQYAPICGCVIRINITFINLQRSRQFPMSWKAIIRSKRVRMQITFVIFLLSIMKSVTS